MKKVIVCAALTGSLAGCANVIMNDGQNVVVEWDEYMTSKETAQETAVRSCQAVGKQSAVEITNVSTNPGLPSWLTMRKSTFRCQ